MEKLPSAIWDDLGPRFEDVDYSSVEREVIIYPDNSLCISGKLVDKDETLVRSLGVPVERPCNGPYDSSMRFYRLRGDVRLVVFPQPSSENKGKNDDVVSLRKRSPETESPIEKLLWELADHSAGDAPTTAFDEQRSDEYEETKTKPKRMPSVREIKTSLDKLAMDLLQNF